jgi:nitrile hydratase accessory protein
MQCDAPIHDLPGLPHEPDGPVFREPWEAHAFALVVQLVQAGYFSWAEWAAALSQEIRAAQYQGDPDTGQTYYHHWLKAAERLCAEKDLVNHRELPRRCEEWRRAYRNTPHGQPIELSAAFKDA